MSEAEQTSPTINVTKQDSFSDEGKIFLLACIAAGKEIRGDVEYVLDGVYLDIYKCILCDGVSTLYSFFDEDKSPLIGEILSYDFDRFGGDEEMIEQSAAKYINVLVEQKILQEKMALSDEYQSSGNKEALEQIKKLDEKLKLIKFGRR